jgi:hypothetical protein
VNRLQYPIEFSLLTYRGLINDQNTAALPDLLAHYLPVVEELPVTQQHNKHMGKGKGKGDREVEAIACSTCRFILGQQHHVLQAKGNNHLDTELNAFISQFIDSFWKGYRPIHPQASASIASVASVEPDGVAMEPLEWMVEQCFSVNNSSNASDGGMQEGDGKKRGIASLVSTNNGSSSINSSSSSSSSSRREEDATDHIPFADHHSSSNALYCPQCRAECGYARTQCLSLCLNYVLVDLFVLRKESSQLIKIKGFSSQNIVKSKLK